MRRRSRGFHTGLNDLSSSCAQYFIKTAPNHAKAITSVLKKQIFDVLLFVNVKVGVKGTIIIKMERLTE